MARKPSTTRLDRALHIRDVALLIVQRCGKFEERNPGPMLMWDGDEFRIIHTTPFQRLPSFTEEHKIIVALRHIPPPKQYPYKLNIWGGPTGRKVLNIEGDDTGDTCLVTFKRGDSEQKMLDFEIP